MSELIQMRQRIKAIQTIKKITHAMRLISMSTHSQLKHQQEPMKRYIAELRRVYHTTKQAAPDWNNPIISPDDKSKKELLILVGSQKGLCGSFNTMLFTRFQQYVKAITREYDLVVIGQKAIDYAKQRKLPMYQALATFSMRSLTDHTKTLFDAITHAKKPYRSVHVFSNEFISFFSQKPRQTTLIPLTIERTDTAVQKDPLWPIPAPELLAQLTDQYLNASIYALLYESLIAEQAARFISMDTATRNAQGLMESTKLAYNKLRQAKITKELIELTGSF